MSPESKKEQFSFNPDRLEIASMVLEEFIRLRAGEKVLFLSHTDPETTNRELISTLQEAIRLKGGNFSELIVTESTLTKDVVKLMKDHQIIWSSCNWDESGLDFYELVGKLEETGCRMVEAPGLTADALDNDGALSEKREVLEERLMKMESRLQSAAGFHVTTSYGTNLWFVMKPGDRKWYRDSGEIYPGSWDNLPGAEIFTTPDEEKVDGVLVLPVLQDEITQEQGVDEFVWLTIQNGKIAKIDGGKSAEKLRMYLEQMSQKEENPESVIQCSEIAFGANEKARSIANPRGGHYSETGVPVVEAEKRLGTMHIAFGSSKHGEEGTEGYTESDVHIDFVIPRRGLTVTAFYSRDDFSKRKNGKHLIVEGGWLFES